MHYFTIPLPVQYQGRNRRFLSETTRRLNLLQCYRLTLVYLRPESNLIVESVDEYYTKTSSGFICRLPLS
jgi:hypothetical protein